MEAIENLDDLLGAVAIWANRDLFYKVMQTSSSWQCFGVVFQFIEDTSTLLLVHIGSTSTCVDMKVHTGVFLIEQQLIKQSTVKPPTQIIFLFYLITSPLLNRRIAAYRN